MPARNSSWGRSLVFVCLLLVLIAPHAAFGGDDDASSDGSHSPSDQALEEPFEGAASKEETFSPPGITGDWGGGRTWLHDRGIDFSADLTQGVQGVMDGGFDEEAEYLGSSELILDVDTEKLGLWPGGFWRVAAEGRFGSDVLGQAGSLSPVNNDALFPSDPDREGKDLFAVTEMTVTQFLTEWIGIYGGLINTTAGDANDYAGSLRSNQHFQNASFLLSTVSLRTIPSISLGGGLVLIPFDWLVGSLTFFNTEESAGSDPFDTNDGWTFVTEWTAEHEIVKIPLRHVISFAIGFDNDFFRLGELPRLEFPPGGPIQARFASEDESWAFWYNGQLDAWTHPDDEERKAGLFLRFGHADDETNPIEWNVAVGVGGTGVFDLRPRDRFGAGFYYIEPSSNFPLPALGLGDEAGFEIFYNAELWTGVNLTADLQYIDSGFGSGPLVAETPDNAWVGGLRLRIAL